LELVGGAASSAVALGSGGTFVRAPRVEAQVSLTPFVDALPIPDGIRPSGSLDGDPLFLVTMQVIKQKLHRDLPPTTLGRTTASIRARRSRRSAARRSRCGG